MRDMKKAFTLVELMIVVAILGILAAIVIPAFNDNTQQAREAAARDNLRIFRNVVELYAVQHNGVAPGYPGDDSLQPPANGILRGQMITNNAYLSAMPKNLFNDIATVKVLTNAEAFPVAPILTDMYGWIYKPSTKTVKLNWAGTDSNGTAYMDY